MKTLHYSIIAIFSIIFIFSNNAVFADNIKSTDSFLQKCNDNMPPIPILKPASVNSSSPKLGILVMQPNSVASVCMKYVKLYHGNSSFETNNTQLIPSIGIEDIQVHGSQVSFGTIPVNNVVAKAQQKIISFGSQENASTVISYTLSAKPDSIGYYHVGIPYMCGNILLAVGFPESQIDASSFQDVNPMCFNYGVETSIVGIQGAKMTYVDISNKTIHSTKLPENISIIPPLQQYNKGIAPKDIQCKIGFALVFKSEDGIPACVTPVDAGKLIKLGWAEDRPIILDAPASKQMPRLSLFTNATMIQPGQAIGITISLDNQTPKPLTMDAKNRWPIQGLDLGNCSNLPLGVAIMEGYYTEQNMTDGHPLFLHYLSPCPPEQPIKNFTFQPESNNVTTTCEPKDWGPCIPVTQTMTYVAYKNFLDNGTFVNFKNGIYTIIGGDEWGGVAIEHFTVLSNSTIFAGNLGSMSCPVMVEPPLSLGGVQFSATIKNSTGFVHYYNSTQYGNVFYLHKGTSGNISVQYDAPANASWFQNNDNMPLNMTNGATLFYMANVTNGKMIMSYAVSLYNDETGHHSMICHYGMQYRVGFAEPCNTDNKGDIPPSELAYASKLLHPEISTSFEPNSVMLYPNSNPVFTATISANSDAMPGTYWLSLERSLCGPGVLAKLVVLP